MKIGEKERILICGAGHQGLAMAAHFALNNESVYIWNRSDENIEDIRKNNTIECVGVVEGEAHICMASSDIREVLQKVIMITTPSTAHKDIARILAPYVSGENIIVLNPGRTFGAIEFAKTLQEYGVKEMPHIAETQSIVYTCRKNNKRSVSIYALKNDISIASLGNDGEMIIEHIPLCIRNNYVIKQSVFETSLANVGMILHCAPVLMNVGWIESEKVDFKYYYDGISSSVASFLENMDTERIKIAGKLGYNIESVMDWLKRIYNTDGENLHECLKNNKAYSEIDAPPSLDCRYLDEDIPNGLVPYEFLAKEFGIEVPYISAVITMAELLKKIKYRDIGRKFSSGEIKKYE